MPIPFPAHVAFFSGHEPTFQGWHQHYPYPFLLMPPSSLAMSQPSTSKGGISFHFTSSTNAIHLHHQQFLPTAQHHHARQRNDISSAAPGIQSPLHQWQNRYQRHPLTLPSTLAMRTTSEGGTLTFFILTPLSYTPPAQAHWQHQLSPTSILLQIAQRVSSSGQHGHNRKSMAICLTITTHLQAPNIGASPKPATIAASPEPANCSIIMSANGTPSPPLPQTSKAHYNGGKVGISDISPMPPQSLQNPTSSGATLPANICGISATKASTKPAASAAYLQPVPIRALPTFPSHAASISGHEPIYKGGMYWYLSPGILQACFVCGLHTAMPSSPAASS